MYIIPLGISVCHVQSETPSSIKITIEPDVSHPGPYVFVPERSEGQKIVGRMDSCGSATAPPSEARISDYSKIANKKRKYILDFSEIRSQRDLEPKKLDTKLTVEDRL